MPNSKPIPKFFRKARKLLRDPQAFFRDSRVLEKYAGTRHIAKWFERSASAAKDERQLVYMWGFSRWKREHIMRAFPEYRMVFLARNQTVHDWAEAAEPGSACIAWGYTEPPGLAERAGALGIALWRMEDGFLRSKGLGAAKAAARSLVLDKSGTLYFDARAESGLERILQSYDFAGDLPLLEAARRGLEQLLRTGASKYNLGEHRSLEQTERLFEKHAGPRGNKKRILLLGQVEDDASLRFGLAEGMTNLDLAIAARQDHPEAELLYRPHPDVVAGLRPVRSTLGQMSKLAHVVSEPMSLANAFECVDHVYTQTSLAGFEAVLRGLPVTVLGCPFYAGWGLTDDRKPVARRSRKLTPIELFAAAYLLYPRYVDPQTGERSTLKKTIAALMSRDSADDSADVAGFPELAPRAVSKRRAVAFFVGVHWRPAIREILSEYQIRFVRPHKNESLDPDEAAAIKAEALKHPDLVFLIWGQNEPAGTLELAQQLGCEVHRFEDGFIRSLGLGAEVDLWGRTNWPLSVVLDTSSGIYYNARRSSDIERLLSTYDFDANPELMARARACMARIVRERVTKYSSTQAVDVRSIYGEKTKRRVLVLGQVESDASIRYGCSFDASNVDLVLAAVRENPDAEVIFKPHPAVMRGAKGTASDPRNLAGICRVLHEDIDLADALETIDHVYVITSGGGFEALLRGIPVTCLGANFYAGWGLTDDRTPIARRLRRLTVEQVFAGFYLLHSRYHDPDGHRRIELEEALDVLARQREEQRGVEAGRSGLHKLSRGDAAGAVQCLRQAISVNRTQPRWHAALGEALAALGRKREALECYEQALSRFPEDGDWRRARANLRASLGERSLDIEADYQRAVELLKDPTPAVVDQLRYALLAGRDVAGPVHGLSQALVRQPSAEALGVLALAEWSRGELERGLHLFEKVESSEPWLAQTLFPLRALSAREKDDWAASLYRRISRRLPPALVAAAEGGSRFAISTSQSRSEECLLVAPGAGGDDAIVHCMRTPRETSAAHVLLPEVSLRVPTSGWAYLGYHRLPPSVTLISVDFGARLEQELGFVPSMELLAVLWLRDQLGPSLRLDGMNVELARPESEQDTPRRKREKQYYRRLLALEPPIAAAPLGRVR